MNSMERLVSKAVRIVKALPEVPIARAAARAFLRGVKTPMILMQPVVMLVAWTCKSSGVAIEDEVVKSKSTPRAHDCGLPHPEDDLINADGPRLTDYQSLERV